MALVIHSLDTGWSVPCHLPEHYKTVKCVRWTNQGWACKRQKTLKLSFRHIRLQHLSRGYLSVSLKPRAASSTQLAYPAWHLVLFSALFWEIPSSPSTQNRIPLHLWFKILGWEVLLPCRHACISKNWNLSEFFWSSLWSCFFWTTTGHKSGSSSLFLGENTEEHPPIKAQEEFGQERNAIKCIKKANFDFTQRI